MPFRRLGAIGLGPGPGQQVDNRYRAFADPRASGQLLGFQSGIDLWRANAARTSRCAGIYFAYANADVSVNGHVTNEAATGYVLRKTGNLNLDAWSGGATGHIAARAAGISTQWRS